MLERRLPHGMTGNYRRVDITEAFFLMPHVPFVFEYTELSAHRGIAGFARKIFHHFTSRRAAAAIKNVHDLAFTARQRGMVWFGHSFVRPIAPAGAIAVALAKGRVKYKMKNAG